MVLGEVHRVPQEQSELDIDELVAERKGTVVEPESLVGRLPDDICRNFDLGEVGRFEILLEDESLTRRVALGGDVEVFVGMTLTDRPFVSVAGPLAADEDWNLVGELADIV